MRNSQRNDQTNFWFGFSLGISISIITGYLFGTKEGRKNVKKFIEATEDLDGDIFLLLKEFGENKQIFEKKKETSKSSLKGKSKEINATSLNTVLDKIKGRFMP